MATLALIVRGAALAEILRRHALSGAVADVAGRAVGAGGAPGGAILERAVADEGRAGGYARSALDRRGAGAHPVDHVAPIAGARADIRWMAGPRTYLDGMPASSVR